MRHRIGPWAAALVFTSFALGCSDKGGERYYWQRDPNATFTALRTYALEQNIEPFFAAREQGGRTKLRPVIQREIERQMSARGFTRAEPGRQADVVVRYFGGLEETAMVRPGTSADRQIGPVPSAAPSAYVPLPASERRDPPAQRAPGRLVIEIVDPRTGRGLWRATADNAIPQASVSEKQLRDAVGALMKQFPPPDSK